MKKYMIVLFLILLPKTISFSQVISSKINCDSTVLITSKQLKIANLIFIEHDYLLKTNQLLNKQLYNYKLNNELLLQSDSLNRIEIYEYKLLTESYNNEIASLNKQIKNKKKTILALEIGGITISVGLFIWLLLK